jgi:hypothetical protein
MWSKLKGKILSWRWKILVLRENFLRKAKKGDWVAFWRPKELFLSANSEEGQKGDCGGYLLRQEIQRLMPPQYIRKPCKSRRKTRQEETDRLSPPQGWSVPKKPVRCRKVQLNLTDFFSKSRTASGAVARWPKRPPPPSHSFAPFAIASLRSLSDQRSQRKQHLFPKGKGSFF